jgi:hypothetical protein
MKETWRINDYLNKLDQHMADKLETASSMVRAQMEAIAPVAEFDGGNYKGSFRHVVYPSEHRAIITNTAEYAPYLEFGTGEYAENGNGRKGGWSYQDPRGNWHFTLGMKPQDVSGNHGILRGVIKIKEQQVRQILSEPMQ